MQSKHFGNLTRDQIRNREESLTRTYGRMIFISNTAKVDEDGKIRIYSYTFRTPSNTIRAWLDTQYAGRQRVKARKRMQRSGISLDTATKI